MPLKLTAAGTVADFHGIPVLIPTGMSGFGTKGKANIGLYFAHNKTCPAI